MCMRPLHSSLSSSQSVDDSSMGLELMMTPDRMAAAVVVGTPPVGVVLGVGLLVAAVALGSVG